MKIQFKENALLKSLNLSQGTILIFHTTVAGVTTVTSQFKKNLITKWKGLADYKEFPSKSQNTSKGLKILSKHNCDLPQNSQYNHLGSRT